jgi:beta-mannosidase
VTGQLKPGENEISIIFRAPVAFVREREAQSRTYIVSGSITGSPHLRKAPCQWGWDWGPQLPPIGIWKDIRIEGRPSDWMDDVRVQQKHENGRVTVSVAIAYEHFYSIDPYVTLKITAPDGQIHTAEATLRRRRLVADQLQIQIEDPQLWWPNGYGAQPLYNVEVTLCLLKEVIDSRSFQIGLRTLELRHEPDAWGESFTFVVNGVPVFAKGADWIPADSFPTRISDAHLEYLIKSAADVHMNMLRVWGGGFYEEERFYDLCDRYGIASKPSKTCAVCVTAPAWRCGAATTKWNRAGWTGAGTCPPNPSISA